MNEEKVGLLKNHLEQLQFEDRIVDNPNRKKIKIINQIEDEIIADIEYANKPSQEGTLIKASDMNYIKELVLEGYDKSADALKIANEAKNISNGAPPTFNPDKKVECDASNLNSDEIRLWQEKLNISGLPIGMIIPSAFIQENINLHLLDGKGLSKDGPYASFYQWVLNNINKVPHYEDDSSKTALEKYQDDIKTFGQCGKFVITDTYVKLPKITEFIASSNGGEEIGLAQLDEFKSHTHIQNPHGHTVYRAGNGGGAWDGSGLAGSPKNDYAGHPNSVDSSTATNQNTGGSETRPKNIRYPYYIVVANKSNELVEVNTECVKTTGNQIISGMKTFEEGILIPDLEV